MNNLLFQKVKCKAYLKKIYDGKFIHEVEVEGRKYYFLAESNIPESEWKETGPGEEEHRKTYYERKDKSFTGFLVGYKDIVINGIVGVDYNDNPYCECDYIYKQPLKVCKCAIIYFANNRKRYVPLEDIEL